MEKEDRNRMLLENALNEGINLLDLRTPYSEEFYASVRAASAYLKKRSTPTLRDTSALTVQNPAQYGEIIYSVKQVDRLSVDLYRRNYASFAVKSPDGSLSYNHLPTRRTSCWIYGSTSRPTLSTVSTTAAAICCTLTKEAVNTSLQSKAMARRTKLLQ